MRPVSTFTCACCGESKSLSQLSQGTLAAAEADEPIEALTVLVPEDLLCQSCEDADEEEVAAIASPFTLGLGRSIAESFELDGLVLDPGKRTAWLLNH